jgi:hypothetical protein
MATAALRPSVQAAITNRELLKSDFREDVTLDALVTELAYRAQQVTDKNYLGRHEAMLAAQAHTLDVLFNQMVRKAWLNVGHYPDTVDKYMRLALRAQAQCRATAETLNEMKNPKPVAFVQQANIASGHQQVNNESFETSTRAHAPAENSEIQQNKLLERQHGERLEFGAPGQAIDGDSAMATVGAVNRSENVER